jgi:hypothetical protein
MYDDKGLAITRTAAASAQLQMHGAFQRRANARLSADLLALSSFVRDLGAIVIAAVGLRDAPQNPAGGRTVLEKDLLAIDAALASIEARGPAVIRPLTYADLPPPETIVELEDGSISALMFVYACEDASYNIIASEQGFAAMAVELVDDEEDPLWQAYDKAETSEDYAAVFRAWRPTPPTPEWTLAYTGDSEDGPVAIFIKPDPRLRDDAPAPPPPPETTIAERAQTLRDAVAKRNGSDAA